MNGIGKVIIQISTFVTTMMVVDSDYENYHCFIESRENDYLENERMKEMFNPISFSPALSHSLSPSKIKLSPTIPS
jgi:hypothetical protein